MAKTLNELADDLKVMIIELNSDAHNKQNFRPERYNNLKISMNLAQNPAPHFFINIALSEAEFDLQTGEKISGGLGPDERFVLRWLMKPNTLPCLRRCWERAEKNRGRVVDKYSV